MAFAPPRSSKGPKIQRQSTKNWLKGIITAFDASRVPTDGLLNGANIQLEQDGTVGPRPSLRPYGPQPLGTVLGRIFEYKKRTGGLTSENWMCSIQNIAGTARFCYAKGEDAAWTPVTTKAYNTTARANYFQIQEKVVIMNGVDSLSYFDMTDGTITTYTQLTTPAAPTLDVATGLTGTNFNVYYAVTANSTVGQTDASPVLTQPVLTDRDVWNKDTQSIKIKWTTVTGVKSWNVYMGTSADGAGQPTMYAIATGLDATTLSFTDNGTRQQDIARPKPTKNSTAGPKTTRGEVINNRAFMVGDLDNPGYVWRGGDFGYELDFSPSHGGGFSPVGSGTKELPVDVKSFRDGQGNQQITVLTKSTNGSGKRFYLTPRELTVGASTFVVWEPREDSGNDGTDSPDGVVVYNNSLFYPSRDGFKTTGTQPQLQNVLSTDRISNTIAPDISRLNTGYMDKVVGCAYEGRIYWALPVGDSKNNEIWVVDLDRGGAWIRPWSIPADWIWLYNDNSGVTHFLVLQDSQIFELSRSIRTSDNGQAFLTSGESGQVRFSEDGIELGKLITVTFTVSRPQGSIDFWVVANTNRGPKTFSNSKVYGVETSVVGWGEPNIDRDGVIGWGGLAWGETLTVPEESGVASTDITIKVNKKCDWWTYGWSSVNAGVKYQISNVTGTYVNIGPKI